MTTNNKCGGKSAVNDFMKRCIAIKFQGIPKASICISRFYLGNIILVPPNDDECFRILFARMRLPRRAAFSFCDILQFIICRGFDVHAFLAE